MTLGMNLETTSALDSEIHLETKAQNQNKHYNTMESKKMKHWVENHCHNPTKTMPLTQENHTPTCKDMHVQTS